MIHIIGIIEILIFYFAYFLKLNNQKRRGITTNQLGIGNKTSKTVLIERLLRVASILVVAVMAVSAVMDTSLFQSFFIRMIGLIIIALGTLFFIAAMVTMKDSWRAGIPDSDKTSMVTTGIYRFSRNPAFLGFDLTYLGAVLAFGNIALIIMAAVTILLMHLQILEEEKFLSDTFQEEYLSYKKRVGRYISFH